LTRVKALARAFDGIVICREQSYVAAQRRRKSKLGVKPSTTTTATNPPLLPTLILQIHSCTYLGEAVHGTLSDVLGESLKYVESIDKSTAFSLTTTNPPLLLTLLLQTHNDTYLGEAVHGT
jgi:hypothetical protein